MAVLTVVGNGSLVDTKLFSASAGKSLPTLTLPSPTGESFIPVGPGKPLTVELVHVYTGKYPGGWGSSPMLITSAVKDLDETGAAAEAVNLLIKRVSKGSNFPGPPANTEGTRLIAYVPAVTAVSTTVTLNLVFENFPDALFDQAGSVFSGVAGLPIFLTQSPYLIGAGAILKLVKNIGDALFNGRPNFTPTFTLNFSDIGPTAAAGYQVYFKSKDDPGANYRQFTFVPNQGLIDPAIKAPYTGDAPYFVVAVDGAQRDNLKGFAPLAATANELATFFNIKDGGVMPVSDILAVFKAKNDVDYGKRVMSTKAAIAAAKAAGQDTTELEEALKANLSDIQDDDLAKIFRDATQ